MRMENGRPAGLAASPKTDARSALRDRGSWLSGFLFKQTEECSHELFADDCSIAQNYVSVINSIQGYFTVPHLYLDGRVSKYVSDARDRNFREGDRYVPSDYGPKVLSPGLFYPANVKSGETTTQFDALIMPKIGTTSDCLCLSSETS